MELRVTDPDERAINRAIALLGDDHQAEREEARAALHRLFRDRRRLENEVDRLKSQLAEQDARGLMLAAEVDRLTAALTEVAETGFASGDYLRDIARAALKETT